MFWKRRIDTVQAEVKVKPPTTSPPPLPETRWWLVRKQRGFETKYIPEGLGTVVHISIPWIRVRGQKLTTLHLPSSQASTRWKLIGDGELLVFRWTERFTHSHYKSRTLLNGGERGTPVNIACQIEGMKFTLEVLVRPRPRNPCWLREVWQTNSACS